MAEILEITDVTKIYDVDGEMPVQFANPAATVSLRSMSPMEKRGLISQTITAWIPVSSY